MSSAADIIFLADGAAESKVFKPEEAQRLREEAVKFRKSAASIFYGIENLINRASSDSDADAEKLIKLDLALDQLVRSCYRIGGATWTHNANKRYLDQVTMEERRKSRAQTPKQLKRERIKNTVLPPLIENRAPRHKQLTALNEALTAEGLGEISQETAERWGKKLTKAMAASAKISD